MSDYMIKGYNSEVRIMAINTTSTVEEARVRHNCSATAISALGRLLTGGALLASTLKEEKEAISLIVSCDGPLGKIVVDASPTGAVRGYVKNPYVDAPSINGKSNIKSVISEGTLTITRFLSNGETFSGTTPLVSGEIASDLTHYLLNSEQIPSLISLGVLVNPDVTVAAAGGFFIQALPGASDETLKEIEDMVSILPPISQMIFEGNTPEEIIQLLFGRIPFEMSERAPIGFYCSCSYEKMKRGLLTLGDEELSKIAKEEHEVEVVCEFCNEKYYFSSDDLDGMAESLKS